MTDPQRATIALFKPEIGPPEGAEPAPATPGRIGWHELLTTDWQEAIAFYSDVFGWQKGDAHDMGAMGTYQLFSVGGVPIGGMFNKPPAEPMTLWTYYFNVDGVEQAAERVKAGGGEIANGPMEVPGGSWIVQCKESGERKFRVDGQKELASATECLTRIARRRRPQARASRITGRGPVLLVACHSQDPFHRR